MSEWFKAAASDGGEGCVAWRQTEDGGYEVGDTKDPQGPKLKFDSGEWKAFLEGALTGKWTPTPMK